MHPGPGCAKKLGNFLIFRLTAGFGTLHLQVAGLHRAVPSTTLDKVYSVENNISDFSYLSTAKLGLTNLYILCILSIHSNAVQVRL